MGCRNGGEGELFRVVGCRAVWDPSEAEPLKLKLTQQRVVGYDEEEMRSWAL